MHAPWDDLRRTWTRDLASRCRDARRFQVVPDHSRAGLWPTAARAWSLASGTHHLVLQDDVEVCEDFVRHATEAISANPTAAIGFFMCAGKAHAAARAAGLSWVRAPGHITAQALCLPSGLAHEWLGWCRRNVRPDYKHDDTRMQLWLAHTKRDLWFTVPCLAEHLGDRHTVAGNRPPIRRLAPWYERRLGPVDWTRGLGSDQMTVRLKSDSVIKGYGAACLINDPPT